MSITKYRPSNRFVSPFGDLMHEFLGRDIGQFFGSDELKPSTPSVNIVERESEFELRMLAPGYTKKDLRLSIENDLLTISAEKQVEELKEDERYTRREFAHSSFSRAFRLPETVNAEGISADLTDGLLTVHIPKAQISKPKSREIDIA
jgi:HSP20 family protein